MLTKIDLYREVLAIEPNSKVFFPLAKELSCLGRLEEAAELLRKGIAFHPDHLEAKFLLIELLTRLEKKTEAETAFSGIGEMLADYPAVWALWAEKAAFATRDPSLALRFLARFFRDGSLTWTAVLEEGLFGLARADAEKESAAARPEPRAETGPAPGPEAAETAGDAFEEPARAVEPRREAASAVSGTEADEESAGGLPEELTNDLAGDLVEEAAAQPAALSGEPESLQEPADESQPRASEPAMGGAPEPEGHEDADFAVYAQDADEADAAEDADDRDDEPIAALRGADEVLALSGILDDDESLLAPEPIEPEAVTGPYPSIEEAPAKEKQSATASVKLPDMGVRTMTMASMLAQQGETRAAMSIYEELLKLAATGEERAHIEEKMRELSSPGKAGAEEAGSASSVKNVAAKRSKSKAAGFLKALAGRLEARASA